MELLNGFIDLADKYRQPVVLPSLAHKIVFALANVCMEESWEILLLASNEYLNGATKMLRGLYERALTLTYISHNPEKAQRFIDYGTIQDPGTPDYRTRPQVNYRERPGYEDRPQHGSWNSGSLQEVMKRFRL